MPTKAGLNSLMDARSSGGKSQVCYEGAGVGFEPKMNGGVSRKS
jgi:hypothetical protein